MVFCYGSPRILRHSFCCKWNQCLSIPWRLQFLFFGLYHFSLCPQHYVVCPSVSSPLFSSNPLVIEFGTNWITHNDLNSRSHSQGHIFLFWVDRHTCWGVAIPPATVIQPMTLSRSSFHAAWGITANVYKAFIMCQTLCRVVSTN